MKSFQQIRSPLIINGMHHSHSPTAGQPIPPVPESTGQNFAMPPVPRSIQAQSIEPFFSITTEARDQRAPKKNRKKTIKTSRKRSDLIFLLSILLLLFVIVCALGAIVFLF